MPVSLLQAKIRGIRSYSPYEHKAQSIDFMPLTLIVGSNGSGKTSVIECLKFIISGDEPPLSDCRRNFLHTSKDPDIKLEKNAPYASIELMFQNARGHTCVAKREMTRPTSGHGKTTSTPSISSSYKIGNGNWNHVHKQDDWSKTIPRMFDLPNQAILNNVVLCHQEDNLWCMSDSSTVKQIFDRIFGCEQYKKEIRYIDAEIKGCKSELSLAERDLLVVQEKVDQLKALLIQSEELKDEIKRIVTETETLHEEIEVVQREKSALSNRIKSIEKKQQEIDLYRHRLSELNVNEKNVARMLKKPIIESSEVSDSELELKLKDNLESIESSKQRQKELTRKDEQFRNNISSLEKRKESVQQVINKLQVIELKSGESRANIVKDIELIKQSDHHLNSLNSDILDASFDTLEAFEKKLHQEKIDQAEAEDRLLAQIDKLSKDLNKLEGSRLGIIQTISSKKSLIECLNAQLAQADPMAKDLKKVSSNLGKMSEITFTLPRDAQLNSVIDPLDKLIEESDTIVNSLIETVDNNSINKLHHDIEKETNAIETKKQELDELIAKRDELARDRSRLEIDQKGVRLAAKEAHNKLVVFQNKRRGLINSYQLYKSDIEFLKSKNLKEKLDEMADIGRQIESIRSNLTSLASEQSKLTENVAKMLEKQEEYRNNIELRRIMAKSKEALDKIGSLEADKGDEYALSKLKNNLKDLEEKELQLRDKRSSISGSRLRIEREVHRVDSELDRHKTTDSKYAEHLGKVLCNKLILSDLEKLKDCFNTSITSFHNQMIKKINEVLRIRWRQIYQGSDIDRIELVDEEITRGKNNQKAFNYYIAMQKGGIQMKMREKSSAGQKALASIILRMTLAELFVKDFAFVALDEPTANLDHANVQSLARAIGNYVRRRNQRGFNIQWIIITHDEQFLRSLDAESSPYYYRVNLDEQGCSNIMKISYQDVQSSLASDSTLQFSSDTQRTATSSGSDPK